MKRAELPKMAAPCTLEPTLHEILEAIEKSHEPSNTPVNPGSHAEAGAEPISAGRRYDDSSLDECVLCSLVSAAVTRGIKALFCEFVNDPDLRRDIRSARGFCRDHTRLVAAIGDCLGISILYADLADQTVERWSRGIAGLTSSARLIGRSRTAPCPACDLQAEADARYCSALSSGLSLESVWSALRKRSHLCAVHVEKVAASAKREQGEQLLTLESEKLSKLLAELNEIIRKHDYRFRDESWGPERDAWRNALARLTKP